MDAQVKIMAGHGLENAVAVRRAQQRVGVPLAVAAALIEGESGGRNIFGNDVGVFGRASVSEPRRYDRVVTEARFREFVRRVRAGEPSNGVGVGQITWPPYFDQAEEDGLRLWVPEDNAVFAFRVLRGLLVAAKAEGYGNGRDRASIVAAGSAYRTGVFDAATEYGKGLADRSDVWTKRLWSTRA